MLTAQGWETIFPDSFGISVANDVQQTSDGGYIVLGETDYPTGAIRHYIRLAKTDAQGNIQWSKIYKEGIILLEEGNSVLQVDDGGYMICGSSSDNFYQKAMYLMRTDSQGDTLWTNQYGLGQQSSEGRSIKQTPDGGFILAGRALEQGAGGNSIYVVKIDADGVKEWDQYYFSQDGDNDALEIALTDDGGYIITGSSNGFIRLLKINAVSEVIWTTTYNFTSEDKGTSVEQTSDGGYLIGAHGSGFAGPIPLVLKTDANGNIEWENMMLGIGIGATSDAHETSDGNYIVTGSLVGFWGIYQGQGFIGKLDNNGDIIWDKELSNGDGTGSAIRETNDGCFIISGYAGNPDPVSGVIVGGMALIKTDSEGNLVSNYVSGNIFSDNDNDCAYTTDEVGLKNWILLFQNGNKTEYTTTDAGGDYSVMLDTGEWVINLVTNNAYWIPCEDNVEISLTEFYDSTTVDFPIQPEFECAYLDVDISAPFLRRCQDNYYQVHFCNTGTITANDVYIEVELDPLMTLIESSVPVASQVGDLYTFEIGDLEIGDCGSINIKVFLSCDTEVGQTHCAEAQIFEANPCTIDPEAAQINLTGECEGDSIVFTFTNISNIPMPAAGQYIVIEDDVMYLVPQTYTALGNLASQTVKFAANGSTYRLETEEYPGEPGSGFIAAVVEGCGTNASGTFSTGFVNVFQEFDSDPTLSVDCQENIASLDPNDKRGFPKGYREQHLIKRGTDLDYHIRFQNTGNDTAFYVEILDTISQHLDVATFRPGSSSHLYTWEIYGNGIISFKFENILLPDSTINEPLSHGFVKYRISQKPDLPDGTIIYNTADIYFDFNEPVATNQTFHTIGEDFIEIMNSTQEIFVEGVTINVYPNPFSEIATFEIEGMQIQDGVFQLFDAHGRLLRVINFEGAKYEFHANDLQTGMYWYRIISGTQIIASGKMIRQ